MIEAFVLWRSRLSSLGRDFASARGGNIHLYGHKARNHGSSVDTMGAPSSSEPSKAGKRGQELAAL